MVMLRLSILALRAFRAIVGVLGVVGAGMLLLAIALTDAPPEIRQVPSNAAITVPAQLTQLAVTVLIWVGLRKLINRLHHDVDPAKLLLPSVWHA
jgi:hypothetical protein